MISRNTIMYNNESMEKKNDFRVYFSLNIEILKIFFF